MVPIRKQRMALFQFRKQRFEEILDDIAENREKNGRRVFSSVQHGERQENNDPETSAGPLHSRENLR